MGYVAAGYIAVFGTLAVYTGWAITKSRRAAARILDMTPTPDGGQR